VCYQNYFIPIIFLDGVLYTSKCEPHPAKQVLQPTAWIWLRGSEMVFILSSSIHFMTYVIRGLD
jgi:hypothetical protein